MSAAASYLNELEGLTHVARQRCLVELGRASIDDSEAQALLNEFSASPNAYVRSLVVTSLYGSRDVSRALELLQDRSRLVRRRTAGLACLICDDAQAALALARCTTVRARIQLAHALRRRYDHSCRTHPCRGVSPAVRRAG